ncbi:MAG: hypothetical protein COB02_09580 [Candidatus Cloacimonadota bacterium]|nr:MAG: hypothetical protein COB02_09580 [Candidatus Cloacimonadota bacterium]
MKILHLIFILFTTTFLSAQDTIQRFGFPRGPEIKNVDQIIDTLKKDSYNLELLISFGTSNGGSAGHLALSVRDPQTDEEIVHSANFYADRSDEHSYGYYTDDLIVAVPKKEYIFGVHSTLSEDASFGLDFGEIFKRSLIGIRIYGVTPEEIEGINNFYKEINQDFHDKKSKTRYERGEVVYDYMKLNCAKSVAQALHFGANFKKIKIKGNTIISAIPGSKYILSHVPTQTTLDIMKKLNKKGKTFDVILYKKYENSEFADHDHPDQKFKDLQNRFPSVKSLDFYSGSTEFEDYDNLFAMNLFYELGKYSIHISNISHAAEFSKEKEAMSYKEALKIAKKKATASSKSIARRLFRKMGIKLFPKNDTSGLYK